MYIFIYIYISLYVVWNNNVQFWQFKRSNSLWCLHVCPLPWCLEIRWVLEGSDIGQGPHVGRLGGDEDFKVHCYALPSSTLTAWGLMAPVRAGLACPVEGRGSWSLLVMPPDGVLPSPTALRTSRMVLFCTKKRQSYYDLQQRLENHTFNALTLVWIVQGWCSAIR